MTWALRPLLASHALVFLVLLAPVLAKIVWGIPPEDMLRDPAQVMEVPMYVGVISNLGLVLWGSAATLCVFAAVARRDVRAYWTYAAALTGLLLLDDWLLLHDVVLPDLLGVSDVLVYAAYGLAVLVYLVRYRYVLLLGDWPLLLLSFAWFAASIFVDQLDGRVDIPGMYLWEDGAKLFGIASWLLFHGRLALALMRPSRPPA
jgi:hypothetical protein